MLESGQLEKKRKDGLFPDLLPELELQLTWTYVPDKEPLIEVQVIRNKGVWEIKIY